MNRHQRIEFVFRWCLLVPIVASLFIIAFIESWAALKLAAIEAEIPHPGPWPWSVDGFILVTALMVANAALAHRGRGIWWPRAGMVAATGLSTVIQSIYAPNDAWYLHAWSPVAVLFSFECLVWLIFGVVKTQTVPTVQTVPPSMARPVGERATALHADSTLITTPATVPRIPAALSRADEQALRRVRDDRAAVDRIVAKRALDRAAVDQMLAKWDERVTVGSSNGHRPMGESAP